MKSKLLLCASVLLAILGMKRYYAGAGADDLWWILGPTARLTGGIAKVSFLIEPGAGYLSRERLFLIEKSCAGVSFMIAAFAMLTFVLRRRVTSFSSGAIVLAGSLFAAYSAAVIVNAARITFAIWLMGRPLTFLNFTPAQSHRVEGITVYFVGLMLLNELVLRVDRGATSFRRAATPLAFYYAVTLALPLANGAAGSAFLEHALVVLSVPPILIVLFCSARGVVSLAYWTNQAKFPDQRTSHRAVVSPEGRT